MHSNDIALYKAVISLFRDVKLMEGNLALNSSIRRHKELAQFIKDFQKQHVLNLESCLLEGKVLDDISKFVF